MGIISNVIDRNFVQIILHVLGGVKHRKLIIISPDLDAETRRLKHGLSLVHLKRQSNSQTINVGTNAVGCLSPLKSNGTVFGGKVLGGSPDTFDILAFRASTAGGVEKYRCAIREDGGNVGREKGWVCCGHVEKCDNVVSDLHIFRDEFNSDAESSCIGEEQQIVKSSMNNQFGKKASKKGLTDGRQTKLEFKEAFVKRPLGNHRSNDKFVSNFRAVEAKCPVR
jgi:hypothetical protein